MVVVVVPGIVISKKVKTSLVRWCLSRDLKQMKAQASGMVAEGGARPHLWASLAFMCRLRTNSSSTVVIAHLPVINFELYFTCWLLAQFRCIFVARLFSEESVRISAIYGPVTGVAPWQNFHPSKISLINSWPRQVGWSMLQLCSPEWVTKVEQWAPSNVFIFNLFLLFYY